MFNKITLKGNFIKHDLGYLSCLHYDNMDGQAKEAIFM